MPAGGYFSTADDISRFCRMLLNDGLWEGKRILSVEAVREMSKRQTPDTSRKLRARLCRQRRAIRPWRRVATNMNIDRAKGLVTVWLVQHAGFPGDGKAAQGAFRKRPKPSLRSKAKRSSCRFDVARSRRHLCLRLT